MFLATTALKEFWVQSEPMVMLGEWCRRRSQDGDHDSADIPILPCPWDNRANFYAAINDADALYESALAALAGRMNKLHGTDYPLRYWRIVLGPWLQHFIHVLTDRYTSLKQAVRLVPSFTTTLLAEGSNLTPRDTHDFVMLCTEDRYNLQLYSELLRLMGHVAPERDLPAPASNVQRRRRMASHLRLSGDSVLRFLWSSVGRLRGGPQSALAEMYMSWPDEWRLIWDVGLAAQLVRLPDFDPPSQPQFDGRRMELGALDLGSGELGKMAGRLLPRHLPTIYLEGFASLRERVLRVSPTQFRAVASLVGWTSIEPFKLFAAEAAMNGARIICAQHGGCYGVARYSLSENHEQAIADRYLVWGWAGESDARKVNVPSPKISAVVNRAASTTGVDSLFVGTEHPRFVFRFHSAPVAGQCEDYFEWQLRFYRALPVELRSHVLYRPPATDFGQRFRTLLPRLCPGVRLDPMRNFRRRLLQARVVVVDNNATTLLEALAADVPVIAFWRDDRWEIRQEALADFEELRRVGVLHGTPESAAGLLGAVVANPRGWWHRPDVRAVRAAFVDRYARSSAKWERDWVSLLRKETALAG